MVEKRADLLARQRPGEPPHIVLYENLHGGALNGTSPLNRHVHTAADRHVRAKENFRFWIRLTFAQDRFLDFRDRKSTRLNSSHVSISYAVFCLKKKKKKNKKN